MWTPGSIHDGNRPVIGIETEHPVQGRDAPGRPGEGVEGRVVEDPGRATRSRHTQYQLILTCGRAARTIRCRRLPVAPAGDRGKRQS